LVRELLGLEPEASLERGMWELADRLQRVLEWFEPEEHERVERVAASLRSLGSTCAPASRGPTGTRPGAPQWYGWLLPRLARDFELLPCVSFTPPSLGIVPSDTAPPRTG
jgi:CDP-paratose 2-epimerase